MNAIPFDKPTCSYTDLGLSTRATCAVPDCTWSVTEEKRHRVEKAAAAHRREHRTALRTGGGSGQMTVYDALDEVGT